MPKVKDINKIKQLLLQIKYSESKSILHLVDNEHDRNQYSLMKDTGYLDYNLQSIGSNKFSCLGLRITDSGQDYINSFERK